MQTTKTTFIYGLVGPESDEVRYVGKTDNPRHRLWMHLRADEPNKKKREWIAGLRKRGHSPVMVILQEVPVDQWKTAERHWISKLRSEGCRIFNVHAGGNGGVSRSGNRSQLNIKVLKQTLDEIETLRDTSPEWFGTHLSQAQIVEMAVRKLAKEEER